MAKRRINRQQAWRIRKIQEERLARAERKTASLTGQLGPERYGQVVANYGGSVEVEDKGAARRCHLRQNLDMPVVGDQVVWQEADDGSGVVVAVSPRRSVLARPDFSGEMKALAANVDQIVVVTAPQPPFSTESLDQFLVAAEKSGIRPLILFNKIDLLGTGERAAISKQLDRYRAVGYEVIYASTQANHGLDDLLAGLRDRTSVFAGQSGVGKSSLIKALLPETRIAIGDLAELTGLGRHTTSTARLYHLPSGGSVIDSPGVREFRLWAMEPRELAEGFVEFRPLLGTCRFRDCRHEGEPGCALAEAAERGEIAPARLESFRRIARALAEKAPSY